MVFEICASLATLAFIILVFYLVQTLRTIRSNVDPIGEEAIKLLQQSNEITQSINQGFSPLLQSISSIKCSVEETTEKIKHQVRGLAEEKEEEISQWDEKIIPFIELVIVGIAVYRQFKKGK